MSSAFLQGGQVFHTYGDSNLEVDFIIVPKTKLKPAKTDANEAIKRSRDTI